MASPSEAGRRRPASLCLHGHDNTAQWALTTFQMEMEYPVKIRHSHLDGTWCWGCELGEIIAVETVEGLRELLQRN